MTHADAPWLGQRRITVIVNPAAHNALRPRRREEIDAWARDDGWEVRWVETQAAGSATGIARREADRGVPLVLVCGGDGTLNEAVNGLAGSDTALGVVPAGTVNLWARELGIKRKKPLQAVQQALTGERRRIDLGRAGSRYFLSMASYGIDAAVTGSVSRRLKGVLGAGAYAIASIREALRVRGQEITLELDAEALQLHVLMVIASNTREYAGITQITPEAVADDGLLDVRIFEGKGRFDVARHALLVLLRLHRRSRKVHYRRVRQLTMHWQAPLPEQVDGDYVPAASAEVRAMESALWVAVPRGFTGPPFSRPPAP